MKILITGGAGFIGHNTAIHLKSQGFNVSIYDNLQRSTSNALKRLNNFNIPIHKGNILNAKALASALKNIDIVIHAAAYINVEESIIKPILYFKNNVLGTANVAKTCLDKNIKHLIYLSSAAVYGDPQTLPINENHPANPISPYGLTKLIGEETVKFYAKQGLKTTILRLFNVYGPEQSIEYAGVITHFIKKASMHMPPIIYGDGEQTRDFIHVNDVAEAIKLTITKSPSNETFNIASGKPTKINDLAAYIIRLANLHIRPEHAEPKQGDIKHSFADISKAERILNFKPKTSLEKGLKNLIQTWNKI